MTVTKFKVIVEEYRLEAGHQFIKINASGLKYQPHDTGALYRKYEGEKAEQVTLKYVPYFIWNNRGEGEMQVCGPDMGDRL